MSSRKKSVVVIGGGPGGYESALVAAQLARRRLGYGRGARMKFEADAVRVLGGVRHGRTMGSPVAIEVGNTEWPKWTEVMSAEPVELTDRSRGRGAALTRPDRLPVEGSQEHRGPGPIERRVVGRQPGQPARVAAQHLAAPDRGDARGRGPAVIAAQMRRAVEAGGVRKGQLVKVLGDGEISVAVNVTAHKFSASAKEKIEAAGGSITAR